ncbi:MAG: ECF transporter S component [Clostridia bacterium]|nr:ECF transporter S component [Clostridia bacterium]
MRTKTSIQILKLTYAAVCMALCMVLPTVTGGIPAVGKFLCPMHLPVLLCGILCGPFWGFAVGVTAPLLRFFIFGAPELVPRGIGMMAELAFYGLVAGLLFTLLCKKEDVLFRGKSKRFIAAIYVSLLVAMVAGRLAGGAMKVVLLAFGTIPTYAFSTFMTAYFVETWAGVIAQLILIPAIVIALRKAKLLPVR